MKIKKYEQFANEKLNARRWAHLTREGRIKYLVNLGVSEKEAEEMESPWIYHLPDDIANEVQIDFN